MEVFGQWYKLEDQKVIRPIVQVDDSESSEGESEDEAARATAEMRGAAASAPGATPRPHLSTIAAAMSFHQSKEEKEIGDVI